LPDTFKFCCECGFPLRDELKVLWDESAPDAALPPPSEELAPGELSALPGKARILDVDRQPGWFWLDKGTRDGLTWGAYYTVYHQHRWKGLVWVRQVEELRSRCKLVLGDLGDVREGYSLALFRNVTYDLVARDPQKYVGEVVVWYGRLIKLARQGEYVYLHGATTFQDDYRELKETFGYAKGLFKTYTLSSPAKQMVEDSIAKGSFLATLRGSLDDIPVDSQVVVVGTPVEQVADRAADGSKVPAPTLKLFHVKYWKRR
jgi:hypothetical protein